MVGWNCCAELCTVKDLYQRSDRGILLAPAIFGTPKALTARNIHPMRIAIGSDHAGIDLKHAVKEHLKARGMEAVDKGAHVRDSVDYPDYAHAVATAVTTGDVSLGIVICGSGNGVNITANKHAGVRSALAWNEEVAALARAHNNANVLALPARFITDELALRIVDSFLDASFEGGRHARRVEKIEPEQAERT